MFAQPASVATRAGTPADGIAAPGEPASACDCAVSVYSSRESVEVLRRTVAGALRTAVGRHPVVDVIVNGNASLASAIAGDTVLAAERPSQAQLRVWSITLGDKAFAWNEYVHRIAPPARSYVFVDGYVRVDEPAIGLLTDALWRTEGALAATGLPRSGRSAGAVAAMLQREGGLHGNLHALKSTALDAFRRLGFRLPKGLYRTDSTIGAALSFGLGLHAREWRPKDRIVVEPGVGWELTPLSWWRPADLRTHVKRVLRQSQGVLENAAVRDRFALRGLPFGSLPATSAELVADWVAASPGDAGALLRRSPLARRALRQLQQARDWSAGDIPPKLLLDHHPQPTAAVATTAAA